MTRSISSSVGVVLCALAVRISAAPPPAIALSISQLYESKSTWERIRWTDAEHSSVWTAIGWAPYEGKQTPGDTYVSQRSLELFGREFHANLVHHDDPEMPQHFTNIAAEKLTRADCTDLSAKFTALFGKPRRNDSSSVIRFSEDNFVTFTADWLQWDIGPTRITAGCSGIQSHGEEQAPNLYWNAKFSAVSASKLLVPKFALRCTRHLKMFDKESDASDMAIWVDTYAEMVTLPGHEILNDAKAFHASDTEIAFTITRKPTVSEYSIDRITGGLSATVRDEKGQQIGSITGRCEKSDSLEAKF